MKRHLRKLFIFTPIFMIALMMTASLALGDMVVFLKNGKIIRFPVNMTDIIGISFEENAPAADLKTNELKAPAEKSVGAGCQYCQSKNRAEVWSCNNPKRTVEATRDCLATAKSNFDACWENNACR